MHCSSDVKEYDNDFVARLRRQDPDAFKKLFYDLAQLVYRRSFSILGRETLAEDATQEIFYKAWQSLSRLTDGNVRAWLMVIARNHCFDELRKRKRRPETVRDFPEMPAAGLADGISEEEPELLKGLSEEIRVPLMLKVIEGLSYKEIAQIVEKSEGTLRNLVCKGMKILREEIADYEL